jgi:pimeloyl-ACP methyl ester carboxylesterase
VPPAGAQIAGLAADLGRELAEPDRAWVPEMRVERIPEASHWVQADAPERVNQLMVDFLQPIAG